MADINTKLPMRFESGGEFALLDGATEYTFKQIDPGTLQYEPGGYEPLNYTDRGEQQFPLEGDERLSIIRLQLKLSEFEASKVLALSRARDTGTGKMKAYGLELRWRDYKGATAGDKVTFAATDGYFTKPAMVRAGERFDTVEIEMAFIDPLGTIATHTFS